jgi:glycosyltransferase 2 family protein
MIDWLSQNRTSLLRLFGTLAAIVLIVLLIRQEGWAEIVDSLKQISPVSFFLALASLLVSRVFVIARWHVLLQSGGVEIPFRRTAELTLMGLFASNFLPTTVGGDVVRLAGVMQMGFDRAVSLASIAADRLVGLTGMLFAVPFGLPPAWESLRQILAAQPITLMISLQRPIRFARRTLQTFSTWLHQPTALFASLLYTWGNMLFIFISIYLLVEGLGEHVAFWLIAGLYSLSYLVTLIPISINGFGLQELSLTYLFLHVGGLSAATSLSLALLIRIIWMLASLPGAAFLPSILVAISHERKDPTPPELKIQHD